MRIDFAFSYRGRTLRCAAFVASVGLVFIASCAIIRHTNNYRWFVKTLTDRDSASVIYSPIQKSTVAEQTRMRMPVLTEDSARQSCEDTVYTIDAYLISLNTESDGDYHLVLRDLDSNLTMRAEIPDPDAEWTPRSIHSAQFRIARASLDSNAGVATSSQRRFDPPYKIRITGVGFFDPPHFMFSHEGEARNCREIHPVLSIELIR